MILKFLRRPQKQVDNFVTEGKSEEESHNIRGKTVTAFFLPPSDAPDYPTSAKQISNQTTRWLPREGSILPSK